MKRIVSVVILAVAMTALWLTAVASATPATPDANTLMVGPIYSGGDTSVKAGSIFTERVRFERTGTTSNLQFEIQLLQAPGMQSAGRPVITKSPSAQAVEVKQTDKGFSWTGGLMGDGFIQIDVPMRVDETCEPDPPDEHCPIAISVNVLNTDGDVLMTEQATVNVAPSDFKPADIVVSSGFRAPEVLLRTAEALRTEGDCLTDCEQAFVVMTNNNAEPARVVIRGLLPNAMRWKASASPIFSDMDFTDGRSAEADEKVRVFDVSLQASETVTLPLNVAIIGDSADGTEYVLDLKVCSERAGNLNCPFADGLVDLAPLTFRSKRRDAGDAPDSSNHFAAPMAAYAGVPANFPTTGDNSLPAPHGPIHARPWPLHLGRQVSFEAEADIGPDQDGVNNIEPGLAVPQADLDRADDGVPLHLVSFEDCKTTVIPVRVAILPAAVARFQQNPGSQAYINAWLDGNRDGDWADVGLCDPAAYEHIVIDHPVDVVTLGAGMHTISVTTGVVPWPSADAIDPAWMRFTLAEEKSPKMTGLPYGDGRGLGTPYKMGETEDYLYYGDEPGSEGFQPQIEITIEEVERGDEHRDGSITDGRAPLIKMRPNRELIIRFENTGFKPSGDLQIEVTLAKALDQILYDSWVGCLTCTRTAEISQSQDSVLRGPDSAEMVFPRVKVFDIGVLQPQSYGTIVLGWAGCLTCTREADAVSFHTIKAKTSKYEWVKQFERTPDRLAAPFIRTAWTGCLTCTRSIDDASAVAGWDEGVAAVVAKPGQTLKFLKNGVPTGQTAIVPASGIYVGNLPVQPDEKTVYQVVAAEGGLESAPSNSLDISCPASGVQILTIDQIKDGKVSDTVLLKPIPAKPDIRVLFGDELGGGNNVTFVGFGTLYNRLVYRTCRDQATDLQMNYLGEEVVFDNQMSIGDVTVLGWTGCLTCVRGTESTEVSMTVVATPTGQSQAYEYGSSWQYIPVRRGLVVDGIVGKALADVEITMLRKVKKGSGRHTWVDVGHCVTTFDDGTWSALVPAGEYIVITKKDGYQPYRSEAILFFDEADSLFDSKSGRFELALDIKMRPNYIGETEANTVDISAGNLGDPVTNIEIGMAIRFVNNGGADTSITAQTDGRAAEATLFDSGQLAAGEAFEVVFDTAGTFTYSVAGDESQQGVIVVSGGSSSSMKKIYLPMITR